MQILNKFCFNFSESGPNMFSKQLKPLSLYKPLFCLQNYLVRRSSSLHSHNSAPSKLPMVITNSGLFFTHALLLSKSKDLRAWYIVFVTFSSMVVTEWTSSMVFKKGFLDIDEKNSTILNFIKEILLLFLIAWNDSITDLVLNHWLTCVFLWFYC